LVDTQRRSHKDESLFLGFFQEVEYGVFWRLGIMIPGVDDSWACLICLLYFLAFLLLACLFVCLLACLFLCTAWSGVIWYSVEDIIDESVIQRQKYKNSSKPHSYSQYLACQLTPQD
jgi:hypothetical protein